MEFEIKELLRPANLLSLSRIPLLILMMVFYDNKALFIVLLTLAIISDALDGYVARKMGDTKLGAFLDPLADKIFIDGLLIFLVLVSGFSILQLVLLMLRDIYFFLIFLTFSFHPLRDKMKQSIKARWLGKMVTVGQFLGLMWLVIGLPFFEYLVYAVAALSIAAVVDYSFFIDKKLKN